MNTLQEYAETDSHNREVSYYIDDCCVATLNLQSDKFEVLEEMTEDEKDEAYKAMVQEGVEFINEFDLS